jgi:hypothetical protein
MYTVIAVKTMKQQAVITRLGEAERKAVNEALAQLNLDRARKGDRPLSLSDYLREALKEKAERTK